MRPLLERFCVCLQQGRQEQDLNDLQNRQTINHEGLAVAATTAASTAAAAAMPKPPPPTETQVRNKGLLKDFNEKGDDVAAISAAKLAKLDRYEKFEKRFPFYRMDINGYSLRIKEAMKKEADEAGAANTFDVHTIKLSTLQSVFAPHSSWSDLNSESSEFVQFLEKVCSEGEHVFSTTKLRVLGLLWCEGGHKEKAFEFYENLQDNDQEKISCTDKDFKPNFYGLLDLAGKLVVQMEAFFTQTEQGVSDDKLQELTDEKYDELAEEFLDAVFEYESTLPRKEWESTVASKQSYLFSASEIRKKLGITA